jgi:hypothetical protein
MEWTGRFRHPVRSLFSTSLNRRKYFLSYGLVSSRRSASLKFGSYTKRTRFQRWYNNFRYVVSYFQAESHPVMLGRWDPKTRPAEILQERGYYW